MVAYRLAMTALFLIQTCITIGMGKDFPLLILGELVCAVAYIIGVHESYKANKKH